MLINSKVKPVAIELLWLFTAFVFGSLLAVNIAGDLIFNPRLFNFMTADMLVHFIGWDFYRHDNWSWPLTYTSSLMYPVGTTMVYTDSIPLFVIILKLFRNYLPEPFVWHGAWAIINNMLMFYSGSLLFRVLRKDTLLAFIGGLFMLLASPMLFRFYFHFSLASQWLLVFNFILLLKPQINYKADICWQSLLLFVACGIHPYIAFMNMGLAFALVYRLSIQYYLNRQTRLCWYSLITSLAIFMVVFITSAYFFGWFFGKTQGEAYGFGVYSANVLSLINPQFGSVLLKPLKVGDGQYEGFAYLGIGIILPLLFLLVFRFRSFILAKIKLSNLGLFIVLAVFTLIAFSNILQIGSISINLPYSGHIFSIFRASGRFIWMLYYFVVIITILVIYDSCANKKIAGLILILLLGLQYADTKPLLNGIAQTHSSGKPLNIWNADLKSDFWYKLKQNGIKHMVIISNNPQDVDYLQQWWGDQNNFPVIYKFALLAALNGITINNMHLARSSVENEAAIGTQSLRFEQTQLEKDTLYIIAPNINIPKQINCNKIDNYNVCNKLR
ncbi:DUF6311 domain-containing protein [Aquella oligotrophica]|uniref:YfhO family protein n=1 Tax=Aquella oligotrophica TaxID=2067065 RepID=A0A2I7N6R5_9NEIS|nr:DUF6311 domain-containing protein [Aquella oligotrophica]AUR52167.1 hypothetical protein CUN60_07590 [Aquella oligotrophica]